MNFKAALVALVVVLTGLYATPVVAEEGPAPRVERTEERQRGFRPPQGGHFNNPIGTSEAQHRIERIIRKSIRHAKKGSTIRIALFSFDRRPMAQELIDAHKRGVNVKLLLNDHQVTRAMRMMNRAFGHSLKRRSWIRQCDSGCRARAENLHSKIFLFSETGREVKASIVGSVNLTTNALIHQWNDGLVMHSNKVHDRLRSVFNEMKRDRPVKRPYDVFNITRRYQLQVLPHNNTRRTNDPIMSILNRVRCKGATGGTGTNGRTRIRVDMHRWAGHRGKYIADKVVNLWAAGCDVKLMHGSASAEVRDAITRSTHRGRVPIRSNGFDESGDGMIDRYTHHKYLLISGRMGKRTSETRVYTGSANWSGSGVRGDEIIFRARHRFMKQYMANFNFIWNNGSRPVPYGRARMTAAEPRIGGPHWEND